MQAFPVNGPFEDPGIIISLSNDNRIILFDAGEMQQALTPSDISRISHIFISHTHMDHFAGFDRILRLLLGRQKELFLFGPDGFLENISSKLRAYQWNLSDTYKDHLRLCVAEIHENRIVRQNFSSKNSFIPSTAPVTEIHRSSIICHDSLFSVSCAVLDHKIPVLGFAFRENDHIRIRENALCELNFKPGPWVREFIDTFLQEGASRKSIQVDTINGNRCRIRTKDLFDQIATVATGEKIAYITDAAYHTANSKKMIDLSISSDHLFIEAAFLQTDSKIAGDKHHLTAHQAGTIAGLANVKTYTIFHFSKRYRNQEPCFYQEAESAYKNALAPRQPGGHS